MVVIREIGAGLDRLYMFREGWFGFHHVALRTMELGEQLSYRGVLQDENAYLFPTSFFACLEVTWGSLVASAYMQLV